MATDLFTVAVWTRRGLQRFLVLFFIELSTRQVALAGIAQEAKRRRREFLPENANRIHDRDPLFTAEFLRALDAAGVKSVKSPPRSPHRNPHAGRFVRSITGPDDLVRGGVAADGSSAATGPARAADAGHGDSHRNSGAGGVRGIWDWVVWSVICNIRAAFGNAGCGPKCALGRRREEM